MLEDIKERVYKANIDLMKSGLVVFTWGNVSEIDPSRRYVVIKPSGVDYNLMKADDMVVVDLNTGMVVDGHYKPSSDTPTHLEVYRNFKNVGGISHTHSVNAVAFAQAGMDIPALGTTHADYFYGDIPCTHALSEEQVVNDYELNTGRVIVDTFTQRNIDPIAIPGCVVQYHGPFAWGKDAAQSVYHAVVIEKVAEMDLKTLLLNPQSSMSQYVLDKHYYRKHGANAYYGQDNRLQ